MLKQRYLIILVFLLIQLPILQGTAHAAFIESPKQIQVYEESYYYSHHDIESLGNGSLITYNDQLFLPVTDVAALLGLTLERRSGDIRLTGSPSISLQSTAHSLPKDPTIEDQLTIGQAIGAGAGVVLEDSSPTPIYTKNQHQSLYPSSTTKIMTALLAIEKGNLNEMVSIGAGAATVPWDSSKAGIKPGDRMTLEQLLYALMLPSGNDAAVAIAEHIAVLIKSL